MSTMKMINNVGLKSRIRQVLFLLIVIIIGILVSHALGAQSFNKASSRHFKSKYKSQIKWGNNACHLLQKKRTETPSKPIFAFLKGKPKYKPMAEVDAPTWAAKSTASAKVKREKDLSLQ
ncbi:MAG TPA: hypothetical protein VKQ08_04185 [Cyclobacteriaceae bacterium]|nr:hypothetical protein [Cyclobacteriaceae bacterium]